MKQAFKALSIIAAALTIFGCRKEKIEPVFSLLGETEFTIPAEGGTAEVEFESNLSWSASILTDPGMTDNTWYTIGGMNGEAGKGVVKVTVKPNTEESSRSLRVRISIGDFKSDPVTITQLGKGKEPEKPSPEQHVDEAIKVSAYDITARSAYFVAEFAGKTPEGYSGASYYGFMYSTEYKTAEDIYEHGQWLDPFKYKTTGDAENIFRTYGCDFTKSTTYYVIACAEYRGATDTFRSSPVYTFSTTTVKTDLNGFEAVDLGLSVKWAKANVGARNEFGTGDYFSWGETSAKETYSNSYYKYYGGMNPKNQSWATFTKYVSYVNNAAEDKIDNIVALEPEDDAARIRMGGSWRTPHASELKELAEKCTWEYLYDETSSSRQLQAVRITGPSGNSIVLPTTGNVSGSYDSVYFPEQAYYRAAELQLTDNSGVWILNFATGNKNVVSSGSRVGGLVIRAVTD